MKVCTLVLGVLVACVSALAVEHEHVIDALQPRPEVREVLFIEPDQADRQKRSLLLGAGALGLGALGVGALGAGAIGASALIGAKAGFIGGALASGYARSYGGYGRSYGGYGRSYGGHGGYGYGGYRSYPTYYSSYPSYYSSWS